MFASHPGYLESFDRNYVSILCGYARALGLHGRGNLAASDACIPMDSSARF